MDETRDTSEAPEAEPDADPNRHDANRSSSADPLVARLDELRNQMEVIAPQDQEKGREALERFRDQQERIAALEEMLATAREREHELTTAAVRDRARIFEADARISELSSIAARVAAAEDARRAAEATATESVRMATLAKTEKDAAQAEIAVLRSRNAELESDMASVADELSAAALARTEAARMERERNEARERAQVERRLAAEDRLRAAEADLRTTELQARLRDAEHRILLITEEERRPSDETVVVEGDAGEASLSSIEPERIGSGATSEEPIAEVEAVPAAAVGADEPPVVIVDETPSDEEATALEAEKEPSTSSMPAEPREPGRPLWSASEPAASVATTADPWAPWKSAEPTMWGSRTPSLSEVDRGASKESDVVDLTGEESDAPTASEKAPEKAPEEKSADEERVDEDSSARPSSGWTDTAWHLLRGRRKD